MKSGPARATPTRPTSAPTPIPAEQTWTKLNVRLIYRTALPKAPDVLLKLYNKQQNLSEVKVDADKREVSFIFSGTRTEMRVFEALPAAQKILARVVTPAIVEFDVKGGAAKFAEFSTFVKERVSNVLSSGGSKLEVMADLSVADWAEIFKKGAESGITLKPKSHSFTTFELEAQAPDEAVAALADAPGVIVVRNEEADGKKLRVVGDAKIDLAGLMKLLKSKGASVVKAQATW